MFARPRAGDATSAEEVYHMCQTLVKAYLPKVRYLRREGTVSAGRHPAFPVPARTCVRFATIFTL